MFLPTKSKTKHDYLNALENLFEKLFGHQSRKLSLHILEIGVRNGASLRTFATAYSNANVIGIDIEKGCKNLCHDLENVDIIHGDATSPVDVNRLPMFDIVIDDGSHLPRDANIIFQLLYSNHLNKGGLYMNEDISCFYDEKYILLHGGDIKGERLLRVQLLDDIYKKQCLDKCLKVGIDGSLTHGNLTILAKT